jgi:diketogulonate reductase-like aldo/keto reductase
VRAEATAEATMEKRKPHQGKDVAPIPGTTTRAHLEENVAAAGIALSKEDLARIDAAAPKGAASGDRYPAAGMANVNR